MNFLKPFVQDLLLLVPSSPGHLNVWFVMLTTLVVALVGLARALSPTRVAVVTGATKGIGLGIARGLGEAAACGQLATRRERQRAR